MKRVSHLGHPVVSVALLERLEPAFAGNPDSRNFAFGEFSQYQGCSS